MVATRVARLRRARDRHGSEADPRFTAALTPFAEVRAFDAQHRVVPVPGVDDRRVRIHVEHPGGDVVE
jgi:hypothetical protein